MNTNYLLNYPSCCKSFSEFVALLPVNSMSQFCRNVTFCNMFAITLYLNNTHYCLGNIRYSAIFILGSLTMTHFRRMQTTSKSATCQANEIGRHILLLLRVRLTVIGLILPVSMESLLNYSPNAGFQRRRQIQLLLRASACRGVTRETLRHTSPLSWRNLLPRLFNRRCI